MLFLGFFLLLQANGFLYNDSIADQLIRQTMQATYDLRLADARSSAKSLEDKYPDHPAGYTLVAETYWWESQMDPGNRDIEDRYYAAQKLAVEKGEAALKLPKYPTIEVNAYLGSAWGSYARFQVTQKEAYYSALRAGLRAHRYAEEVYAADNSYYDIYVGLGAFNYFTGSLPAVIKPFAWLFGARGDRDLGIEQLKTAMAKARYSQTEARIVYYTAMLEDKNWPESFRILEGLRNDHPDNFVMYTWVTDWYRQQSKNLAGADYFEKVYNQEIKRSSVMAKYALLEKAQLQDAENHRADAISTLNRLKSIPGSDPLITKKVQALEKKFGV
jgi:hypothetical protein